MGIYVIGALLLLFGILIPVPPAIFLGLLLLVGKFTEGIGGGNSDKTPSPRAGNEGFYKGQNDHLSAEKQRGEEIMKETKSWRDSSNH